MERGPGYARKYVKGAEIMRKPGYYDGKGVSEYSELVC
jgi:hypothetical protein